MGYRADINEQVAILALSRVQVQQPALLRQMMDIAGSAKEIFDNLDYINDILPGISPTLAAALRDKSIVERAEREMEFVEANGIKLTCLNDSDYPARLFECSDAPIALYSLGDIPFNAPHIVSIVGTRHATAYGKDMCTSFVHDLARLLPGTLVVT